MAELALAVVGLAFPALIEVYKAIRETCSHIAVNDQGCALLVRKCTDLLVAIDAAQRSNADASQLKHEVELLTQTLQQVKDQLAEFASPAGSPGGNYFRRWKRSRKAGEKLAWSRQQIQDTTDNFLVISAISVRNWTAEESEARKKDQEDVHKSLGRILRLLERQTTDISNVTATLLPRALQQDASAKQVQRAKDEGTKAAASFSVEVEALRPPPEDPSHELFQSVVSLAIKLFRAGEAIPAGYELPQDFFDDMPHRSNLLDVRVRYLESGVIIDDQIVLRHYQTLANLIWELRRPRPNLPQPYDPLNIRLYVRHENAHQLTRRGLLWTPIEDRRPIAEILPRRAGGWHEVDLVESDAKFLIALVDDGTEERGAVLDYPGEGLVHSIIRQKWPYKQVTECLRIDVIERKGYVIQEADSCKPPFFEPYRCALCIRFSDGNGHTINLQALGTDGRHLTLSHTTALSK